MTSNYCYHEPDCGCVWCYGNEPEERCECCGATAGEACEPWCESWAAAEVETGSSINFSHLN